MKLFGYEFIIRKAIKKKKGFSSRTWTKKDTDLLLEMYHNNEAVADMATTLNRTANSINSRLHKVRIK